MSGRGRSILISSLAVLAVAGGCTAGSASAPAATPVTTPTTTRTERPSAGRTATPIPASIPSPTATPTLAPGSPSPTPPETGLPPGWAHELRCDDESRNCRLHLRDAAGAERPGWPARLAGTCFQYDRWETREEPRGVSEAPTGPDGTAYVACDSDDRSPSVIVHAVRLDGSVPPGWPAKVKGTAGGPPEVAPNGSVYVGAWSSGYSVHAFHPDGGRRTGWPRRLPGDDPRFIVAPDGAVVAWWHEGVVEGADSLATQYRRTRYTTIGPDGRTLPGWPITSIGMATAPVASADGGLFYTSATAKAWGHDRSGAVIDGWPYQLFYQVAPVLRPDGRLLFVLGRYEVGDGPVRDAEVIVLTTTGRVAPGWPYRTSAELSGVVCCTDCSSPSPHAVSSDGTLYLAPWTGRRAEVVALDGRGRVRGGWPYPLPAGSRVTELEPAPGGGVVVTLRDCSGEQWCCGSEPSRRVVLTRGGRLAP